LYSKIFITFVAASNRMAKYPYKGYSMNAVVTLNYQRQSAKTVSQPRPTLEDVLTDICQIFDIDPVLFRADGRANKRMALIKRIYCYATHVLLARLSHQEIADKICLDRSSVTAYIRQAQGYIKIQRSDFVELWELYARQSIIWKKRRQ
jgi:hypothetical protein